MSALICIDGVSTPPETASIPVLDRGFLYGDSAFEVLRTYDGQLFAADRHLDRLLDSCARLGIPPVDLDVVRGEIDRTLAAAANAESYVRVVVTRGITAMGLSHDGDVQPRRVVVVLPLPEQPAHLYAEGAALATVTTARALDGTGAAGAKASNYLPNILALAQAKERGAYEAISVAAGGELLEGSTSNLFLVKDGALLTPPLDVGILDGITRQVVIEAARGDGLEVRERLLFPPDLYRADEAFITSTLREVIPMVRADGVPIGDGRPGPITRRAHAAFRARVRALLAAERAGR